MQNITIQKIIPKAYLTNLQLSTFFIGIIHKKHASIALKIINRNIKTEQKIHLKRIKKIDENVTQPDVKIANNTDNVKIMLCQKQNENMLAVMKEELKELLVEVIEEELPSNAPGSKEQFKQWQRYWPINFIQQQIFKEIKHSEDDLALIQHLVNAKEGDDFILFDNQEYLLGWTCSKQTECCQYGTVRHQLMKMLDAWPKTTHFQSKQVQMQMNLKDKYYYLTGLKIIVKKELCGMCAMALVHSRVQRLYFYSMPRSPFMEEILNHPKLNHRVQLFFITL